MIRNLKSKIMPIIKSAKKALRQNKKRRIRNLVYKRKIKNIEKDFLKFLDGQNKKELKKILNKYYKIVDKAVKIKLLKKNTASRKKSKLAKMMK